VVAVLAVLAVGALVVVVVTAGGDDPPSDAVAGRDEGGGEEAGSPADPASWTAPAVEGSPRGEVIRSLVTETDLVVVTQRSITSIERGTGELRWHTHLEELDGSADLNETWVLCGASTSVSEDGKLAVTAGFDESPVGEGDNAVYAPTCGLVILVDLASGELAQNTQVAYEGAGSSNPGLDSGMPVEIVGDTVVVTWYATIFGLDLGDLSEQWRWVAGTNRDREPFDCVVDDMARGEEDQLVVGSTCISEVGEVTNFVDELSVTGEVGRGHEITAESAEVPEISSVDLVTASPVVIQVFPGIVEGAADDGVHSLVTLDDSWAVQSVIHDERTSDSSDRALVTGAVGFFSTRTGAWTEPSRSIVVDGKLISFTPPNQGPNELVAVDLATGEELWTAPSTSGSAFWQVLAVEEGAVVALAIAEEAMHQSVVRVDLASGEVQDEVTTEVGGSGGAADQGGDGPGLGLAANLGYVYADGRAYGVEFSSAGEAGAILMAFTVG
jgi:hypothetical protein